MSTAERLHTKAAITPSVTDILTPATGMESEQTTKWVENVLPPLSRPKPSCPLKQLQAPLTREEETYFTHVVQIKLEQSKDKTLWYAKWGDSQLFSKRSPNPGKSLLLHLLFWERKEQIIWTKCGQTCQVPQLLTHGTQTDNKTKKNRDSHSS